MHRTTALLICIVGAAGISGCAVHRTMDLDRSSDVMVRIPAGWFQMGTPEVAGRLGFDLSTDELPQHRVFTRAFLIDRFEVTEKQYLTFLRAIGSKKYPGYWKEMGRVDSFPDGYANYPVSDVDWFDAKAYCTWIGKRLPTEVEWERAARGSDGRQWPWGDQFDSARTNTVEARIGWKAPVGSRPGDVSPFGVYDMAGNVKEWTASSYSSYPGNPYRRVADGAPFKILRGGSYLTEAQFSRTAFRVAVLPTMGPREEDGWHSDYTYGFRCAQNP